MNGQWAHSSSLTAKAAHRVTKAPALASTAFILLVLIAPILVILSTPSRVTGNWTGPLIICVLSGARYTWIIASGSRRLYEMMLWLFGYVFLGIAPLAQLRLQIDPSTTPRLDHDFDFHASAIVIAGMAAAIIGSWWASHRPLSAISSEINFKVGAIPARRIAALSLTVVVCGAAYIAVIGPANLFTGRDALSAVKAAIWPDQVVSAVVTAGVTMGLLIAAIAQIDLARERKVLHQKRPLLLLILTLVLLLVCVNFVSSPRYVFGTVTLGLLAALGGFRTLARFRTVALLAPFALVLLFPLADFFRNGVVGQPSQGWVPALVNGDFDSFGQIINTAEFASDQGTTLGRQFLGVLLFWVPRSIWPEKPSDTGILLANFKGYDFTNLSAPIWSELFMNSGWFLLVPGMVLLGFALRRADSRSESQLALGIAPSALSSVVPFYLLLVYRGSLLQAMAYLVVILALGFWVRRREPR